jgi:hypothetical protein
MNHVQRHATSCLVVVHARGEARHAGDHVLHRERSTWRLAHSKMRGKCREWEGNEMWFTAFNTSKPVDIEDSFTV